MSVIKYSKKIKKLNALLVVLLSVSGLPSCTTPAQVSNTSWVSAESKDAVIKNYANIAYASYQDSLVGVKNLQSEVNKFIAKPSKYGFDSVKTAWLKAMALYGQTECFRFYEGPVDNETGPGERMNPWPVGTLSVDYGESNNISGIINNPQQFPNITREVVMEQNNKGGEKDNITGFHAIEFLIWGEDPTDGPGEGQRPYTDYITDGTGTGSNQARRAQYLTLLTDLLVKDMEYVAEQWQPDKTNNYRTIFLSLDKDAALGNIFKGIATLAEDELPILKMAFPLDSGEREQELSGFSDSTTSDLRQNTLAINNILNGTYSSTNGEVIKSTGINDLVEQVNPGLAAKLKEKADLSTYLVKLIKSPFDQEIRPDNKAGNQRVKAALDAIKSQGETIINAGFAIGLNINTEE